MTRAVFLLCVACGRLGFGEGDDEPAIVDATPDTTTTIDAEMCVANPCTLVPQCGCPAGQACQRTGATTDTRSCIAEGTAAADEVCSGDADCVAGHMCIAQPTGARCHRYCANDTDCGGGIECADLQEGTDVGFCGSTCTLASGCPTGTACKVVLVLDHDSTGPVAAALCADPAGASGGQACNSSLDCAAGLFCDDQNICRVMCRFDGTLDCAAGTCMNALAPIMLGGVAHGFCR